MDQSKSIRIITALQMFFVNLKMISSYLASVAVGYLYTRSQHRNDARDAFMR